MTAAISDEEKKRLEEQERTQKYSELTFLEKVSFSGALVWGYRTNFIFGAAAVVIFLWCLQHLIDKHFGSGPDNMLFSLLVLFLSSFANIFVGVCFATLISHIADHGDPDSSTDLLFAPSNGARFLKIAPTVGIWALIYSGINLFLFSLGESSSLVGIVANVAIISCAVPLAMCVVYYIADTPDFSPFEGVGGPLKIFVTNIIGWLLFIPVSIFTIISAVISLGVVLALPTFGFVMLGLKVVLGLAILMLTVCYIFAFGCYVYKETAAKLKLANPEEE